MSRVASWFNKNGTVRVLQTMKILDLRFSMETFERKLCEYIVPQVVNTYLSADNEALKSWYSEAVRLLIFLLLFLPNSNAQLPNLP